MSRRYDQHIRVSSDCKQILDELKEDVYDEPDDATYGELIAYLSGYYFGSN